MEIRDHLNLKEREFREKRENMENLEGGKERRSCWMCSSSVRLCVCVLVDASSMIHNEKDYKGNGNSMEKREEREKQKTENTQWILFLQKYLFEISNGRHFLPKCKVDLHLQLDYLSEMLYFMLDEALYFDFLRLQDKFEHFDLAMKSSQCFEHDWRS